MGNLRGILICTGWLVMLSLSGCGGGAGSAPPAASSSANNSPDVSTVSGVTDSPIGSSGGGEGTVPIIVGVAATIVRWTPPTVRENGDFLRNVDIEGYNVYYGLVAGDYQNHINVNNSADPQVDLTDLPSGVYYLVITSIDTEDRESLYSPELLITL